MRSWLTAVGEMNMVEEVVGVRLAYFYSLTGMCVLLSVFGSCGSAPSAQEGQPAITATLLGAGSATRSQIPTTSCIVDGEEVRLQILTARRPREPRLGDIVQTDESTFEWLGTCDMPKSEHDAGDTAKATPNIKRPIELLHGQDLESIDACVVVDDHSELTRVPEHIRQTSCLVIQPDWRHQDAHGEPRPVDMSLVSNLKNLRILSVTARADIREFSGLPNLAWLDLERPLHNPEFKGLESFKSLTYLRIRGNVRDLSGLVSLPKLTHVDASGTELRSLPTAAIPSLKKFTFFATKVSRADAESFARNNPNCHVEYSYQQDLQRRLVEADSLVVSLDGKDRCRGTVMSLGANATKELVSSITLKSENVGGVADLTPDVVFEFYRGEELLARQEYISAGAFRSYDWPGDVATTAASNLKIRSWFKRHSIPHECLWFWDSGGTK